MINAQWTGKTRIPTGFGIYEHLFVRLLGVSTCASCWSCLRWESFFLEASEAKCTNTRREGWGHTSNLSRIPRIYPCKFFLAGVNFYRFNAKNWHFDRFYVKKWLFFFTDLTRKIGVFRCKFYSPKILPV